jgi:hypothetical protein
VHWRRFSVGSTIPDATFAPPRALTNTAGAKP